MKIRPAVVLVMAMILFEWKFAASMGAARAMREYHSICNGGVGEPYADFIHELRMLSEHGDTNRLAMVLRRADEHSRDIYDVWLANHRNAYRASLGEILRAVP